MGQAPADMPEETQEKDVRRGSEGVAVPADDGAQLRAQLPVCERPDRTPPVTDIRWVITPDSVMATCDPHIEAIRMAFLELLEERERKRLDAASIESNKTALRSLQKTRR